MDCALWLCGKKVFSADEIYDYFDIAAIRGYFLGGSLIKWLDAHGGGHYADALRSVDPKDPSLNDKLIEIFTGVSHCDVPVHKADEYVIRAVEEFKGIAPSDISSAPVSSFKGGFGFSDSSFGGSFGRNFAFSEYGSFSGGSFSGGSFSAFRWNLFGGSFFNYGSFGYSSFGYRGLALGEYGSYSLSSFRKGSFLWSEWEWEWYLGSFRKRNYTTGSFNYGSFSGGSFSAFRWNLFGGSSFNYGSFNVGSFGGYFGYGSFSGGSFRYGSFPWNYERVGSFIGLMGYGTGSFTGSFKMLTPDEYDEIMYRTLNMCPLDRFGYGIHLI